MKLVHALLAMAVISALENVASTAQRTTPSTPKPATPGEHTFFFFYKKNINDW